MEVRAATEADLPDILRIYNQVVETSTATFDIEPVSLSNRRTWLAGRSEDSPVYVCEHEGSAVGFAFYGPYRAKPAYRATVEVSVYVDRDFHGRGAGSALLERLVTHAAGRQAHVLLAVIAGDNPSSVALHEKFGFERVGCLREVGCKFGAWVDTALYQRILD